MIKNKGNRTYSMREVSKKVKMPVSTIRQWEKDLDGLLVIPRGEKNARRFTEKEINLLKKIKDMRKNNMSKEEIRAQLEKELNPETVKTSDTKSLAIQTAELHQAAVVEKKPPTELAAARPQPNIEEFFAALEQYKIDFIKDIKDAVASNQAAVIDEMKKELSSPSIQTVKQISKSIQRANEKRRIELEKVSDAVTRASEQSAKTINRIADSIKTDVKANYDRLSQTLAETSKTATKENKNLYLKFNKTMKEAKDTMSKNNHSLEENQQLLLEKINEIKQNTEEIQERERIFQEMLKSVREAAAAKPEKKAWWKIWSK